MIFLEFFKYFFILFAIFLVVYIPAVLFTKNGRWYARGIFVWSFALCTYVFYVWLSGSVGCYVYNDPLMGCSILPGIVSIFISLFFAVIGFALLIVGFFTRKHKYPYDTKTNATTPR